MRRYILILIILIFLVSCSNKNSAPEDKVGDKTIEISNFVFSQEELTLKVGDTVTWINKDNVKHTVTSDSGNELASEILSNQKSYSHTFNSPGEYTYHCSLHPNMKAKVIVQ